MSLKEQFISLFKKDLNQYGELGKYLKLTIKYGWMLAFIISLMISEYASLVGSGELALLNLSVFRNFNFIEVLQIGLLSLVVWVLVLCGIYLIVFLIIVWLPQKFMVPMDAAGRYQFEKTKCPKCYKQVMTITQLSPPAQHYHAYCESCHHQFNFML